jgi:hypothetical protein
MTTTITPAPVRDDVAATPAATHAAPHVAPAPLALPAHSRLWAGSGVAAAVTGIGGLVATGFINAVYDPAISGDADAVYTAMADSKVASSVFHVLGTASALLLLPFAAGLLRRLRVVLPGDSLLPALAAVGVALTSAVLLLGTGLDTEFGAGLPDRQHVVAENVSLYGHWVGTIPYVWTGIGVAGLAVFAAARLARRGAQGGVPRWLGRIGLVLGGLTVVAGVSPLEYVAGMVGPLWLLVTATGFLLGDRSHRARS